MSDQTPRDPDSEATPPEATPPEATSPIEQPAPEKSGRGKVVAIVAGLLVLVLVAGSLGAFFLLRGESHKLTTPKTAGSLERDTDTEQDMASELKLAEKQFRGQGSGKNIEYVKLAIYREPGSEGTEGSLAFLGAKLSKKESPSTWLDEGVSRLAKSNNLRVSRVSPGEGGGRALCATSTAAEPATVVCAWATEDTRGEVVPISGSFGADELAKIMRELRADVEQTQ